ncbi:unnamed protein product [Arabidopsis lyrata]|nr:unnamed protein product [Arabidopsis lyrata]
MHKRRYSDDRNPNFMVREIAFTLSIKNGNTQIHGILNTVSKRDGVMKEQVEIQASPSLSLGLKSRETLYLTIRHEESGGKCAHLMKEPDESYQRDGEEGNNSLLNPDMLAADDDVVKSLMR